MQRSILVTAAAAAVAVSAFLLGCVGDDPVEFSPEHSIAACLDGEDNDGDGNYDCYDMECRHLSDSLYAAGFTSSKLPFGDTLLCSYEKVNAPESSSSAASSSSGEGSSSSGTPSGSSSSNGSSSSGGSSSSSSVATGYPVEVAFPGDSTQLMGLVLDSSGRLVAVGRSGTSALFLRLDTNGALLVRKVLSPATSSARGDASSMIWNSVSRKGANYLASGTAVYTAMYGSWTELDSTGTRPNLGQTTLQDSMQYVSWSGVDQSGSHYCFTSVQPGTVPSLVTDANGNALQNSAGQDSIVGIPPYAALVSRTLGSSGSFSINAWQDSLILERGVMRPGNAGCAAVGWVLGSDNHYVPWYLAVDADNSLLAKKKLTVSGFADIQAYALALDATGSGYKVAVVADGTLATLDINASGSSVSANSTLGTGVPHAIVKLDPNSRYLVSGNDGAGHAKLWLLNINGGLLDDLQLDGVDAFDAIQLADGDVIVVGWASSSGTAVGRVWRVGTDSNTLVVRSTRN